MKELLSIYVSLFLVFSPLYGQTKQEEQLRQQRKSEWKENWNIRFMGGELFLNVALLGLKGDSLVISDTEITRTIYIGSIYRFISNTGKSGAKTGALIGFIPGFLLGLMVVTKLNCDDGQTCVDGTEQTATFGGLLVGGVFAWFGAAIGGRFKQDKIYNMSDWSIDEKKDQIRKIMKSENE